MRLYNYASLHDDLVSHENVCDIYLPNLMHDKDKFKGKFRIASTRLPGWDYGSHGLYYITICTKDRVHYFGDIVQNHVETHNYASLQNKNIDTDTHNYASLQNKNIGTDTHNYASLRMTSIGEIAHKNWLDIPNHFPFVELDAFVVMPNHLHGILFINKPYKVDWQPNKFGSQSQNLASITRNYKGSVKAYATTNNIEFAWQPRYYDRIIRNEKEYINVREYIWNNPYNWLLNGDNEDNLYP